MWLIVVAVFVGVGIVLRRTRDRWAWSPKQRWVVALLPAATVLIGVAALLVVPMGMQVTDRQSLSLGGVVSTVPGTPRPVSGWSEVGSLAVGFGLIALLIAIAPLGRGVRPWPRRGFVGAATALTVLSVLSFSLGTLFFPAALVAWIPVVSGPRT